MDMEKLFLKTIKPINGKEGYFRVTPGTPEESERFVRFVRNYFGSLRRRDVSTGPAAAPALPPPAGGRAPGPSPLWGPLSSERPTGSRVTSSRC